MARNNLDFNKLSENEIQVLYKKLLQEKNALEQNRAFINQKIKQSKNRTIDLFGKVIDLKKAQRIISQQNQELEAKNEEINRQKNAIEHTFQKFRNRTIDLFGKMIDLKKANKIIQQQKDEIDKQRKLLHETNASKDKFFSIVAHDLKNPIAGFLGLTEIMVKQNAEMSVDDQQVFADSLHESSKQLYNLLENLLHWARSQTGSLQINKQNISVKQLLDKGIHQVSTNAQLKNIAITIKQNSEANVYADKDTLVTIIRNLLSNAIKFSNRDNPIDVTVTQSKTMVSISIHDYGVGMDNETLKRLFKIDQNTNRLGTDNEQGTGLGLILCKEFIKLNGGDIRVDSIKGEGSTFTITIPPQH